MDAVPFEILDAIKQLCPNVPRQIVFAKKSRNAASAKIIENALDGKGWADIPTDWWIENLAYPRRLTLDALRIHMPGLLVAAISCAYGPHGSLFTQTVVRILTPLEPMTAKEWLEFVHSGSYVPKDPQLRAKQEREAADREPQDLAAIDKVRRRARRFFESLDEGTQEAVRIFYAWLLSSGELVGMSDPARRGQMLFGPPTTLTILAERLPHPRTR